MKHIKAQNGVEYLKSEILSVPHGFSTRLGGVSTLSHTDSLNLAFGRGDEKDTVLQNLRLFAEAVGFDEQRCVSVSQIHSADVRVVDESHAGQGYFVPEAFSCDGYVTTTPNLTIGVKTADCVPILMEGYSTDGKLCAVGAVHAGWRGSVAGIAVNAIEKLTDLGACAEKIKVAVGPAICGECFEVREDFYISVRDMLGAEKVDRFVISDENQKGVWHCDLKQMNFSLLLETGVVAENIDVCGECTCCAPELYFSHRYSKGKRGTALSVIRMP